MIQLLLLLSVPSFVWSRKFRSGDHILTLLVAHFPESVTRGHKQATKKRLDGKKNKIRRAPQDQSARDRERYHATSCGIPPVSLFFIPHSYFPAQLVGIFTLSDLLDKPWSQVSCLQPPGMYLEFLSRIGFSIPTARRFSSNVANSRSRALR